MASGDYGLVYRVLRMVDSAKQQAQGGTFCLGGYIAPPIPGGGKVHGKLLDHLDLRSAFSSPCFWGFGVRNGLFNRLTG